MKSNKPQEMPTLDFAELSSCVDAATDILYSLEERIRLVADAGLAHDLDRLCRASVKCTLPGMNGLQFEVIVGALAWALCSKYRFVDSRGHGEQAKAQAEAN